MTPVRERWRYAPGDNTRGCTTSMQASDYIAIGSAVVSVCALGATMWQGWIAYKHNRLSVRFNEPVAGARARISSIVRWVERWVVWM